MKYKEGNRVRIKSLDWYNENKNKKGNVPMGQFSFNFCNKHLCGTILTIRRVLGDCYLVKENDAYWTDEMIEGLVEEEAKPKFKIGYKVKWYDHTCNITSIDTYENTYIYLIKYDDYKEDATFARWVPESELTFEDDVETKPKYEDEVTGEYYSTPKYLVRPNGYQFVDENGNVINATKIVLEKKKKEYPKIYEECCNVLSLGEDGRLYTKGYKASLIQDFQKLLICRDAYWKIAGEEMGLGKPWEPDWNIRGYYAIARSYGNVIKTSNYNCDLTFVFPTEEMRDAFYENFKELIEQCKGLL